MKKCLSLILIVMLLISFSVISYADSTAIAMKKDNSRNTEYAGENAIHFEEILDKLEKENLIIELDLKTNKLYFVDSQKKLTEILSKDEIKFLYESVERAKKRKKIKEEDITEAVSGEMKKFPTRTRHEVKIGDDLTVIVEVKQEFLGEVNDSKLNTYTYSETAYSYGTYYYTGDWTTECTYRLYDGLGGYAQTTVRQGVRREDNTVTVNSYKTLSATLGLIGVSNKTAAAPRTVASGSNTTLVYGDTTFYLSRSVGVTLSGIFSYSISASTTWEQGFDIVTSGYGVWNSTAYTYY